MTIYFIEQRTIKHIKGYGRRFSLRKNLSEKRGKKLLDTNTTTLFRMEVLTSISFSVVEHARISPQNFLILSFNPFATLV